MSDKIDKEVFRQWLVGIYFEYAYDGNWEAIFMDRDKAIKARKFSYEVLNFLEHHDLIKE